MTSNRGDARSGGRKPMTIWRLFVGYLIMMLSGYAVGVLVGWDVWGR